MAESAHNKLQRVRPPRVHIRYDVETEGGVERRELPFVVGVMGDFSGNPTEPLKSLTDRKFVEINRDNFDKVLSNMNPGLQMRVENTLEGDGSEMGVQLEFNKMADFSPQSVARQVKPLAELLDARDKLKSLQGRIDRSEDLENLLESILTSSDQIAKLSGALQGNDAPANDPSPAGGDEPSGSSE